MNSRTSKRFYGSDDLPQLPPRKRPGYWLREWLNPPRSSVNFASSSSIQVSAMAHSGSSLTKDPRAVSEPVCKKRKYALLGLDMEEEQVTRDLCTNFQNVEFRTLDVVPWRSSSNSPNGMELQQSGTTSEEDLIRDGNDIDSADTIRSAAELLTQLTCGRNGDSGRQYRDVASCGQDAGQDLEKPIRWGVKKKVTYESRRSVDSCDLGLCTGLIRKFSYDHEKTAARMPTQTPDKKIGSDRGRQDFHNRVMKWDQSSPNYPASSKFCKEGKSSGDDGTSFSPDQSPGVNFQGPREKHNTVPSSSRASPGNILKLPKEMQGRWSSERYKTAQLKLIDIMHARKAVPGKPILRPALREEARKHIGDTGLLDHLLKHMTDTVVSTGERFRRRHNSEGAMEYWLEHANLMELRKAAGVEDPSWIPPVGWKAGDKLPDRNWQLFRGMTSSEAAEMENLKETVERLQSDMGVLCGSIKVSNQKGVMTSLSVSHHNRIEGEPERAEEEEDPTQGIQKDTTQFKTDVTTMELQHYHGEHYLGPNLDMERFQNLDSAVLQMHKVRKPLKETPLTSGSQLDLESELQDVRKTVAEMQAEVSHIICLLGIVQPVKATALRYEIEASTAGNPKPLMLTAADQTRSITSGMLPESKPPGTSEPVLHDLVISKLDGPIRQCSDVKNVNHSGSEVDVSVPYTDGLSEALSNYKLVNQPDRFSAHDETRKLPESSRSITHTHDCVPANVVHIRPQNFRPIFANQPTGFRLCRPPGSFVWPSMMNFTTKNPPFSRQEQNVELRGLDAGSGNIPMSTAVGLANYSSRSIAESQVAATMATMFGCMAMAPQGKTIPTLPLMTNGVDVNLRDRPGGTATNDLGQCSSAQSNPALSLSLSLSTSSGNPRSISPSLKKQKSI